MKTTTNTSPFTHPDTLAKNQAGVLTTGQIAAYHSRQDKRGGQVAVAVAIVTVMAVFMLLGFLLERVGLPPDELFSAESPLVYVWGAFAVASGFPAYKLFKWVWDHNSERRLTDSQPIDTHAGEVVWSRQAEAYSARSGLRQFKPLTNTLDLTPGRYTFHTLRGTNWLLSAQQISADTNQLHQQLQKANRLDSAALHDNRTGQISAKQQRALLGKAAKQGVGLLVMLGMAGFVLWAFGSEGGVSGLLFTLLTLGFIGVAFYLAARNTIQTVRDSRESRVDSVTGPVEKIYIPARGEDDSPTYKYRVNGMTFFVSREAYNALVDGLTYTVYFSPESKHLVNIELAEGE